jgi:UDP-glucose 4-epimerase
MITSLVTGGAGFIGSHIVDRLVESNHRVIVLDDESATTHVQFYHNQAATYFKVDICDYKKTRSCYKNVDYVFHLAAKSRIQPTIQDPVATIRTNVLGTNVVLQCAREAGVRRVVSSSTSSIYGLKNPIPLREDMPEDCLNPYSVSKFAAEKLCKLYSDLYDLSTISLRYFNVYGEREPTQGIYAPIVGLFLKQYHERKPLTIVPDGHQRRDFTYVQDVVDANIAASTSTARGIVVNIGTGTNISINELASAISTKVVFVEPRVGEARETLADIRLAKNVLNWKPKFDILEYVAKNKKLQDFTNA